MAQTNNRGGKRARTKDSTKKIKKGTPFPSQHLRSRQGQLL